VTEPDVDVGVVDPASGAVTEDRLNRVVSTLLDAFAGLAIAAGLGLGLARWLGWFALAVAGLVLLLFSVVAAGARTGVRAAAVPPERSEAPPGPTDAGPVHMRGTRR
jgi:hypothetical protein